MALAHHLENLIDQILTCHTEYLLVDLRTLLHHHKESDIRLCKKKVPLPLFLSYGNSHFQAETY